MDMLVSLVNTIYYINYYKFGGKNVANGLMDEVGRIICVLKR